MIKYLYQASDGTATGDTHITQCPAVLQSSATMAQLQEAPDLLVIGELHKKCFLQERMDRVFVMDHVQCVAAFTSPSELNKNLSSCNLSLTYNK